MVQFGGGSQETMSARKLGVLTQMGRARSAMHCLWQRDAMHYSVCTGGRTTAGLAGPIVTLIVIYIIHILFKTCLLGLHIRLAAINLTGPFTTEPVCHVMAA
jgi:hypothetical protein